MVRADLLDSGTVSLAQELRARCSGIPRSGDIKDLTQLEAELAWRRDRNDSAKCAEAGLTYVDHIEARDKKLSGSVKK